MIYYRRIKCWWNGRKDGQQNYPITCDESRPEFENELHRACGHELSVLAKSWHEGEKKAEAAFRTATRGKEKAGRALESAKKTLSASEMALSEAERLSEGLEHVSPGRTTYLALMALLILLEFPLNAAVFEVFGRSTLETWIFALVPSFFIPILAHFMGQSLKRGLRYRTPLTLFGVSVTSLSGLLAVQAYIREKYFTQSGYQHVVGFTLNTRAVTLAFLFLNLVIALVSLWLSYNASPSNPGTYSKTTKLLKKAKKAYEAAARRLVKAERNELRASEKLDKIEARRKHDFAQTINEAERVKNAWGNFAYYYRHVNMQNRSDKARPACFGEEPRFEMPETLRMMEWQLGANVPNSKSITGIRKGSEARLAALCLAGGENEQANR
jgi:hypothetical protein